MSKESEVYEKMESEFDTFMSESASFRKQRLLRIEHLVSEAKHLNQHAYLSEKCTGLLKCCREMSRLRQPHDYDEDQCISFALGDLSGIKWILVDGGPTQVQTDGQAI